MSSSAENDIEATPAELDAPLGPPDREPGRFRLTRRRVLAAVIGVMVVLGGLALISEGFTSFIKFLIMLFIRLFIRIISLVFRF